MINIIKENDKYIVQKIKDCSCTEKQDDCYKLLCNIKEKGIKTYTYSKGHDYLINQKDERLYLSIEAKTVVQKCIDTFEKDLEKFDKSSLDYLRIDENCFLLMIKKKGKTSINSFNNANDLAHYTMCQYDEHDENKKSILNVATQKKDRLLVLQLKSYYCEATIDEIHELEKLIKKRILPCLPSEYNRPYAVIESTIDYQLLKNSGYRFIHQPYFTMKDATHKCYSLNPHTKTVIDAAKMNEDYITFDEYLKLFN